MNWTEAKKVLELETPHIYSACDNAIDVALARLAEAERLLKDCKRLFGRGEVAEHEWEDTDYAIDRWLRGEPAKEIGGQQ